MKTDTTELDHGVMTDSIFGWFTWRWWWDGVFFLFDFVWFWCCCWFGKFVTILLFMSCFTCWWQLVVVITFLFGLVFSFTWHFDLAQMSKFFTFSASSKYDSLYLAQLKVEQTIIVFNILHPLTVDIKLHKFILQYLY